MSMVNLVLEDSLVRDLLEDAVDLTQHGGLAGSSARLEAATPVISVVSPMAFLHISADTSTFTFKSFSMVQRGISITLPCP